MNWFKNRAFSERKNLAEIASPAKTNCKKHKKAIFVIFTKVWGS
jgi:hypothetical protein